MRCGGSGCYSIALSPLLSPLGIKTHFSEVGLRDAGSALLALFFSRPSCAPFTLAGICQSGAVGISFPKHLWTQLEFLKRNVLGYVCNPVPRRNETLRREATLWHPASGCFIPEADAGSTARALCCLADYVTRLWRLAHLLDSFHMCSEHGYAGGVP